MTTEVAHWQKEDKIRMENIKTVPRIIIPIDRTVSFDPETFLGSGWTIEREDELSLGLELINPAGIKLEGITNQIAGEERLKRLEKTTGYIRLDAEIFKIFWKKQKLIPESWKEKTIGSGMVLISFEGTVLRGPDGNCYVLSLVCFDSSQWYWARCNLRRSLNGNVFSAVL
ncbi:MAG: hypothetical protein ABH800_01795 [Candidatus Nealsonbacteria bacterium]